MLLVNYSVEALIERFSAVELGQDVQLLLIDNDHHLVVHPDPAQIGTIASPELVSQLVGEGGAFTTVYKGVSVAVSYTRSSKAGWIVVSLTPLSTLNAKAANIGLSTLSLLVVSLVIVAIVAGILNRDLVTPIRTITQRINALQGGKLGEEMALPEGGKDEIGDLVRGYNLLLHNEMEKARVEKEREALIIQLEEARRFAEENARLKTEFLSTMSHELRTPMNAIEGFTSIMLSKMGGVDYNDKTTHYLNRVQANSKRLLGLINDFLDLSRVESGRLELSYLPFAPLKLAERLQSQIGVLAESKGLTFAVEIDPNLPNPLYGDEEAIAKVVINLLSNAIKFTEKGTVALQMHSAGHQWRILVVDTGIGIPPHARDYIFEEFRQVDQTSQRKYGGTGLGLAIVQKYTRTMGGTVTVQSEVGEGSTFTVLLPAHTTPQQE
jgi:signal transduction histidine kinase